MDGRIAESRYAARGMSRPTPVIPAPAVKHAEILKRHRSIKRRPQITPFERTTLFPYNRARGTLHLSWDIPLGERERFLPGLWIPARFTARAGMTSTPMTAVIARFLDSPLEKGGWGGFILPLKRGAGGVSAQAECRWLDSGFPLTRECMSSRKRGTTW